MRRQVTRGEGKETIRTERKVKVVIEKKRRDLSFAMVNVEKDVSMEVDPCTPVNMWSPFPLYPGACS